MADFVTGGGSRLFLLQTARGSTNDGTGANSNKIEVPFTTESFNPVGDFINSNAIAGGRSRGIGSLGNSAGDGSFDTEFSVENMAYLMYGALGRYDTTNFVVYPSDGDLPKYSAYIRHGSSDADTYKYIEQQFNNLRLTFSSDSVLTASIDAVGTDWTTEALSTEETDYVLDDGNTLFFPKNLVALKYLVDAPADTTETYDYVDSAGTDALNAMNSIDITIANNIDTDTNKLDASGRMGTLPGELAVTGTMEFTIESTHKDTLLGLDIGDSFHAIYFKLVDDPDSITQTYYLHLRHIYFTGITHNIDSRGRINFSADFQCAMNINAPDAVVDDALDGYEKHPLLLFVSSAPTILPVDTSV